MRVARLGIFCALLIGFVAGSAPVMAGERVTLGFGRLLTNDVLGDGEDRWRTGSYVVSKLRGRSAWTGQRPTRFGDILEYRLRGEVFAPQNLTTPVAGDRQFGGAWSLGVHTHYRANQVEVSMGADLVITGKQTGLGDMQRQFHDVLGVTPPSALVLGNQIANGFHPTISAEIARPLRFSDRAMLRPFIEGRAGDETLARIGADLLIGRVGQKDLLLRDVTTGHLYRGTQDAARGGTFVLGADIAKVESSIYLPASGGYVLTDTRSRLRAGLHWQSGKRSVFYGVTWLSEEFVGQPEGQLVGSVRIRWRF